MSEWQHGLCGCFDNAGLCIITYFVPCYTAGKNAEAVGKSCGMYCCLYFIPIVNFFIMADLRGQIRNTKGIDGTYCNDLLLICFCPLCALVQEAQEVQGVGGQPGPMAMVRE